MALRWDKNAKLVGHAPVSWFCWFGRHKWETAGWADYGRGRLEKCGREGCKATRRVVVPLAEIQDALAEEYEARVEGRAPPDPDPSPTPPPALTKTTIASATGNRAFYRVLCVACREPVATFACSRCPSCGANPWKTPPKTQEKKPCDPPSFPRSFAD